MAGLDSVSFDFQERFMQKREPLSDPNFNWERFEVTAQSNRSRSSYQLQVEPAGSSPAVQLQPPQKENVRGRKGKELFESILRSRYPSSLGSSGQCYRSGRQVFQNVANERGRARANVFVQFQTRTKDRLDEKWLKENRRTWYEEASGYNPLVSAFKDKLEAYKKSRDRERERESAETEQGTETTTCGLTSHLEAEETSGSSEETGSNEEGTYGATKVEDQQELSTSRRYQESVRQNNCADVGDVGDVGEVGAAGVAGNVGEEEIDEEEDLACPEPAPLPDKMFQTQELSFGSVAGNALVEEVEEAQVHRHQSQNETTEDNASNGEESPSTFKPRSPLKVKEQSVACESQGGSSGQKDLESELQRREKEVDSLKLMNENLRNRLVRSDRIIDLFESKYSNLLKEMIIARDLMRQCNLFLERRGKGEEDGIEETVTLLESVPQLHETKTLEELSQSYQEVAQTFTKEVSKVSKTLKRYFPSTSVL